MSLSLDPELVAEAREVAGRGGLSSLVNDGLRLRLQQLRVVRLLDEMDDEFGAAPNGIAEEVTRTWQEHDRRSAG